MTTPPDTFSVQPIGYIRSEVKTRESAPRQGDEGAPNAWLELFPAYRDGLHRMKAGDELIVLTWLHLGRRDVLQLHPRRDPSNPLTGVFLTRSPDRPNPIGLHRVKVWAIDGHRLHVGPLEALDGTPVIDLKPVLAVNDA